MKYNQTVDTADFEVDGKEYSIMLFDVDTTFKLQIELVNHGRSVIKGGLDPELLLGLSKAMLANAEVDGAPINLNDYARKPLLLDKVVMGALKANMPDFFEAIESKISGFLSMALEAKLKSASALLKSETSSSKQKTTGKRSKH